MTAKIESQSYLIFETLNFVPSSFCYSDIGCRWKYSEPTDMPKAKCDGH